jgi:hypothetical protein
VSKKSFRTFLAEHTEDAEFKRITTAVTAQLMSIYSLVDEAAKKSAHEFLERARRGETPWRSST